MDPLRSVLRWVTIGASALVVLGFFFFASAEVRDGSTEQIARVSDDAPVVPVEDETTREESNGAFREFVDDANDALLAPFENVVTSDNAWVTHGVPALLALLVYGLGGTMLLNYALPRR